MEQSQRRVNDLCRRTDHLEHGELSLQLARPLVPTPVPVHLPHLACQERGEWQEH